MRGMVHILCCLRFARFFGPDRALQNTINETVKETTSKVSVT